MKRRSDTGFVFKDRSGKIHGRPRAPSSREDDRTQREASRSKQRAARPDDPSLRGGYVSDSQQRRKGERKGERKSGREEKKRGGGGQPQELRRFRASVDKNRRGFAFLQFENRGFEDAFVPPRDAETLFHGDRVEVAVDRRGEVHEIRVTEHRFRELVGRYTPHLNPGKGGWVVYERKKAREEVHAPQSSMRPAPNDWVRAKLHFHEQGPYPVTAEIVEVFGQELPARVDVRMIANEFNLTEEHPAAAEREARELRLEIPGRDLEGRDDLRRVPFITIDGETARDFDDAVHVEREKSGYALWVAIADVSHYVREGCALDADARSRGTSVYFPERAFHMLPRALSEGLCSLRPNQPRLAMVAKMRFDRGGKIDLPRTQLFEAVIESKRRATYNEIEAEWREHGKDSGWEFSAHFDLYRALREMRARRGSIDFDLPEAEVVVDADGEPTSCTNRSRLNAHRLIEEFMIAANEAVTEWMMEREWPFIYRVHEEPSEQSLSRFQELAATVGIRVSVEKGPESPKVLAEVVRRVEGHPAQMLLNIALLRSMKQAVYSSIHGIHFGLASRAYTHFTSPIRRYPDLVVHRLLRRALRVERRLERAPSNPELKRLEEDLEEAAAHCSYRERLAADADREAIKLKQVRLMRRHLGAEFEAKIVGMAESGLFVQVAEPYVEGFVNKDTLGDDFYQFNEERMVFAGRRKKRTFQIGQLVKIRVARADLDRREIDFVLDT